MTPNNNDFLPQDYSQPKTRGNYLKIERGETRFRILSKAITGWLDWDDKKPIRFRMENKPVKPIDPEQAIKHFWAFVVWDYKDNAIKVLEITQTSVQNAIKALVDDNDWGNPFGYDIKITKSGEKMETKYVVSPAPHKPISEEMKEALRNTPVNLDALYSGGDPFAGGGEQEEVGEQLPF